MLQFRLLRLVTGKTVKLPPQETQYVNGKWPAWSPIGRKSWAVLKAAYWFVPQLKAMRWCKWKCVKSWYRFFFKSDHLWGNSASHTTALVYEWNKVPFHKTTHVQASNFPLSLRDGRMLVQSECLISAWRKWPYRVPISRNKTKKRIEGLFKRDRYVGKDVHSCTTTYQLACLYNAHNTHICLS